MRSAALRPTNLPASLLDDAACLLMQTPGSPVKALLTREQCYTRCVIFRQLTFL